MLKKKKTSKVNKVLDRLTKIKEAVGDQVSDETIERVFGDALLQDDFDDADWDSKMAEIFNEQYYNAEIENLPGMMTSWMTLIKVMMLMMILI